MKRNRSEIEESECESRSPTRRRIKNEGHQRSSRRLVYPVGTKLSQPPALQYPYQLTTFSYSPSRKLEFSNAAMRYYVEPPLGADLSYEYDTWIKRPEERGRLDGLLEACLRKEVKPERARANVVSWRGVMTKILTAPYEEREGWKMNVMCINDTLYFEEHVNEVKLKEKENMTPHHRLQSYFGYAFESYCTSATPDPMDDPERRPNGWGGNINTNVQWCSVVKTKLGNSRLIIGGEVDCVQGKFSGQPNTFVELKTSLSIGNLQDEAKFERKMLRFYFQSFLLGVPEIKVGFRTPAGRLTTIQSFKTVELPRLVRGKVGAWDPNLCLSWGNEFIAFLKSSIDSWDFNTSEGSSKTPFNREEKVWRVRFVPGKGAEVKLLDDEGVEEVRNGEKRVGFLPLWYWDEIAEPRGKHNGDIENVTKSGA